jgi:signal recognition particle receptor subunit alpha
VCHLLRHSATRHEELKPRSIHPSLFPSTMIDHFAVFSKTGTVLWSKTLCKLTGDPIDTLINRVLMEDRSGEKKFINDAYQMQWVFENKLDLVFVVVYQKILQLLYIEELLEIVKKDFIALFPHQIAHKDPVTYDEQFLKILKSTELKFAQKQTRSGPRVRSFCCCCWFE